MKKVIKKLKTHQSKLIKLCLVLFMTLSTLLSPFPVYGASTYD